LGFTLIEIVMVLVIIGLVAGIALPSVDFTKYRVDSAMRGIGTTLVAAQRYAVTRQHDEIILFDASTNAIRVLDDANNNGTADTDERVRAVSMGDAVVLGRASANADPIGTGPVTFTRMVDGFPALTFHRNGATSEYGGFYLTSVRATRDPSKSTDARLIVVERSTGHVSWFKYNGSTWVEGF
jgi:prepilin-type N-terminal cleavage/methylation domain-containing protein